MKTSAKRNWFRGTKRTADQRRKSRPARHYRPRLETLEDRRLLAVFTVNSIVDSRDANPGDGRAVDSKGLTTIGAAVEEANALAGRDVIRFAESLRGETIELTFRNFDTDHLRQLEITEDLIMEGLGADDLTISAKWFDRIFEVAEGVTADISEITLAEGSGGLSTFGGDPIFDGGAILNAGTLMLENVNIVDSNIVLNPFTGSDGLYFNRGGAIFNRGLLVVKNSMISGNVAGSGGGIYNQGDATLIDSTVFDNASRWLVASATDGGGITNEAGASLSLINTLVWFNIAPKGAGISNDGTADIAGQSRVTANLSSTSAIFAGGAIYNGSSGQLRMDDVDVSVNFGAIAIDNRGDATISSTTISGNGGSIAASAIRNRGEMRIRRSTIDNNNSSSDGAGILNHEVLTIVDSTIMNNSGRRGAGIYADRFAQTFISNSTISGNHAEQAGGGIENLGRLAVFSSTITDNHTDSYWELGGGIFNDLNSGILILHNTIVSGNFGPDFARNNIAGLADPASSHNLLGYGNGGLVNTNGNRTELYSSLAPLAQNGGPTQTHALRPYSPAINAGNNVLAIDPEFKPLEFDQRGEGFDRILNDQIDIGALEFRNQPPQAAASLEGLVFQEDMQARIDLGEYFVDPDADDFLRYDVTLNNNPSLVDATIDGSELVLDFLINRNGEFTLEVTATDFSGASVAQMATIPVVAVNDPPAHLLPSRVEVFEDQPSSISGISIFDDAAECSVLCANFGRSQDADQIEVTLSVSRGTLEVDMVVPGGLPAAQISGSGSKTVTLLGSVAQINNTLAASSGLTYLGEQDVNGTDFLVVRSDDLGNRGIGDSQTTSDSVLIAIEPVNDEPVNTVPASLVVGFEDVPLRVPGISVFDVDATDGSGQLMVTLEVESGTLRLSDTVQGGLTADQIEGNGTATITMNATQDSINATLASPEGLAYLGHVDFFGTDTLQVVTNDLGNWGSRGPLQDIDVVTLNLISATAQVMELSTTVESVDLRPQQTRVLTKILDRVSRKLSADRPDKASRHLRTFTRVLEAYRRSGILDGATVDDLLSRTEILRNSIETFAEDS